MQRAERRAAARHGRRNRIRVRLGIRLGIRRGRFLLARPVDQAVNRAASHGVARDENDIVVRKGKVAHRLVGVIAKAVERDLIDREIAAVGIRSDGIGIAADDRGAHRVEAGKQRSELSGALHREDLIEHLFKRLRQLHIAAVLEVLIVFDKLAIHLIERLDILLSAGADKIGDGAHAIGE